MKHTLGKGTHSGWKKEFRYTTALEKAGASLCPHYAKTVSVLLVGLAFERKADGPDYWKQTEPKGSHSTGGVVSRACDEQRCVRGQNLAVFRPHRASRWEICEWQVIFRHIWPESFPVFLLPSRTIRSFSSNAGNLM